MITEATSDASVTRRTGPRKLCQSQYSPAADIDDVFSGNETRVIKTPVRSPQANAFAERFVGTPP